MSTPEALSQASLVSTVQDGQLTAENLSLEVGDVSFAYPIMAKQRGGPKFLARALIYPVTDAEFDNESYREFAEGYAEAIEFIRDHLGT
jgi:hypothetical protein